MGTKIKSSIIEKSVKQTDTFLDICIRNTREFSSRPTTQIAFSLNKVSRQF
jgi:hypothetical protein